MTRTFFSELFAQALLLAHHLSNTVKTISTLIAMVFFSFAIVALKRPPHYEELTRFSTSPFCFFFLKIPISTLSVFVKALFFY
jgi:hypothetical protein